MEWSEVVDNPLLRELPFKIELDKFGKLLMSPASNHHGRSQMRIGYKLFNHLPQGEVIAECSIQTPEGVKVADIAWASSQFIDTYGYQTPYPKAPELCIEVVSPSNSKLEILGKVKLYLEQGAKEVWLAYENGKFLTFDHSGEIGQSLLAPGAQSLD